ncbi:hypothetical protein [Burkholderia sp. Leaf177]|uniref:hypothetical protein n=1 Tax=Burkholderia sp. Leaf177 TaxID=1736287 RepID=UPI000A97C61E|nr:hypothetical protein [Burkholderia sp. Leaf177]
MYKISRVAQPTPKNAEANPACCTAFTATGIRRIDPTTRRSDAMEVNIENVGDANIRVIRNGNTIDDEYLEAAATELYEANEKGVIELRQLGDEGARN